MKFLLLTKPPLADVEVREYGVGTVGRSALFRARYLGERSVVGDYKKQPAESSEASECTKQCLDEYETETS